MPSLELNGVRLRDIGPVGVLMLAVSTFGGVWLMVDAVLNSEGVGGILGGIFVGVLVVGAGLAFAYGDLLPDVDGACENCGTHIVANRGSDDVTEYVEVNTVGAPRRLSLGSVSIAMQPKERSDIYCSPECAGEDERYFIGKPQLDTMQDRLAEVNDAD